MIRALALLLFLVSCGTVQAAAIAVDQSAPEGFEQLDTLRATSVTLYYGGELLGSFSAHFKPGTLQFDQPDKIIGAIPAISKKDIVKQAFQEPLPANANYLCTQKITEDCGVLTPEIAGIIFDEARLSAEVFVNKKYLSVVDSDSTRYLPLPERHLASVYAFNGAINGTDSETPSYSLSSEAVHSFGEIKLATQTTLADKGLRFDTAAASIDRKGWNATGGLFRSRSMQLISDRDMAGVAVSTSRRTLLDSHKTEGNDIVVYLPRRSFVSIYREGRLYSSRAYDAGNQQIDTSELPDGAYTITLRIQEPNGTIREENRFFAKSQSIPAKGEPVYYAQAGVIRMAAETDSAVPELTGDPILRLGTVRRVTDNAGLSLDTMTLRDRAIIESGAFFLTEKAQINMTALGSSKGDTGVQASYLQTMSRLNIAVDARKMWAAEQPIPGFEDAMQDIEQVSAVINYGISPQVSAGLRGNYAKQPGDFVTTSIGPYMEWRIWQKQEDMLTLTANAARTDERNEGSMFLQYTKRFDGFGVSSMAGVTHGPSGSGPTGNTRIWRDTHNENEDLTLGAGLSADSRTQTASADADWRNNFGQVRGTIQESAGDYGNVFSYGGSFSFSAAQVKQDIYIGGKESDKSAVIVETSGDASDTMKIFVNGTPRSTVKIGGRRVIYLTPFHTYTVRIAPEKSAFLDYENSDRKVTLYPGNVVKLSWKVNKFYVVSARIVNPDGTPLANALLGEARAQIATNDKGYLQAEIALPDTLAFTGMNQTRCRVQLPKDVAPHNGILMYKQPLVCIPEATGTIVP